MLKEIVPEEEGSIMVTGIKREREGDSEEEGRTESVEEKSSETTTEKKSSEFPEEEYNESEEEDGEDTCVYGEYEDRSGEPVLDIDSEDEDDEHVRAYCLHLWKSEGFEALPELIEGRFFGARYPSVLPSNSPYHAPWLRRAKGCAKFAVKHYNKRRAGSDGELEFVELVNVTSQGWFFFYVTFDATNLISGVKTYQAKVEKDTEGHFSLYIFREKRDNLVAFDT